MVYTNISNSPFTFIHQVFSKTRKFVELLIVTVFYLTKYFICSKYHKFLFVCLKAKMFDAFCRIICAKQIFCIAHYFGLVTNIIDLSESSKLFTFFQYCVLCYTLKMYHVRQVTSNSIRLCDARIHSGTTDVLYIH